MELFAWIFLFSTCLFKISNENTRTRCEICWKLTIKTPEWRHWHRSGVFIVNFDHIFHLVLAFLLLTLSKYVQVGLEQNLVYQVLVYTASSWKYKQAEMLNITNSYTGTEQEWCINWNKPQNVYFVSNKKQHLIRRQSNTNCVKVFEKILFISSFNKTR